MKPDILSAVLLGILFPWPKNQNSFTSILIPLYHYFICYYEERKIFQIDK